MNKQNVFQTNEQASSLNKQVNNSPNKNEPKNSVAKQINKQIV